MVETKVYATDDSAKNCLTFPVNEVLSVRLYRDNKPNCLETSLLQKGLVLVYKGKELIEEGMGFGVPVVKFQDKTLFSSNAQIIWGKDSSVFEKHFLIDTISTKQFCNAHVNDNFYEVIHKMFEKGYLGHQTLQPVNNKIMELRSLLKIKTHFKQVKPRGTVKIKYAVKDVAIEISADFSGLNRDGALEFLLLNEQGASSFGCYKDTDGLRLADSRIGAWDLVSAKKAVLTNRSGNLGFSLEPKVSTMLFRGWEKTRNRFSWAGLSYSLPPSRNSFYYYIELNC